MPETAKMPVPGNGVWGGKIHSRVLLVGAPPERVGLFGDDFERARIWRAGVEVLEANSFGEANDHLDRLGPGDIQAILVNLVGIQVGNIQVGNIQGGNIQGGNGVVSAAALEELQVLRARVPFCAFIVIIPGTEPEFTETVFRCGANDCLLGGSLKPEALARSLRFNIDRHKNTPSNLNNGSDEALPGRGISGYANSGLSGYNPIPLSGVLPISSITPSGADGLSSAVVAGRPLRPLPRPASIPGMGTPLDKAIPSSPLQYGLLVEANEQLKAQLAERRRSEHALKEALAKAEAANLAKNQFLARISHEIRTPMNGIIGMTELVLDTELNSRQREYLHLVSQSAESLLGLINDVLDFSKIEAGTLEIESEPFSLRDLLGDVVRSFGVAAASKGLELVLDIRADVPSSLVGDAGRLRQVLINLIGNAVKFTDSGGVTISVALKGDVEESRFALVQVADTGIGIPAGELDEIFEAFAQVDPSTTRRHTGTGLGLTITKSLVEQLGGTLQVQSVEGKGSLFEFTLPILDEDSHDLSQAADAAEKKSNDLNDLKGLRALVLEAHFVASKALTSILIEEGILYDTVQDRAEAGALLEAARRHGVPYDLVLVGSTLEGGVLDRVAGTRFCDTLSLGPEPRPSVILMLPPASASVEVQRAWTFPTGLVLSKPVVASSLREAIYKSLRTKENPLGQKEAADAMEEDFVSDESLTSPIPMPRRKILVVEDNLISQRVAETILGNEGYLVNTAHNGQEAIDALLREPFDLVLMDLQMPEMDGLEATRAIRLLGHMRGRVPIIATTAHALNGDRERCLEAGSDYYLPKPFHKKQLLEIVATALKGSSD